MTARLDVTPKTTGQNRIVRTGKSEAGLTNNKTSSSAVAKRPRDASCLSVVSLNSTKRRVLLVSLHAVKCAVLLSLA